MLCCTYRKGIESVISGSLEENESEDSGIAVMAFGKDKVFNVFENSMSLQLVALCQDCHPSEVNSEVVIVYKIPDAKKTD